MYVAQKACPVLSVQDVDRAIEEYSQYGFALTRSFGTSAVHAILTCGDVELHLSGSGPIGKQSVWIVVDELGKVEQLISGVIPEGRLEPAQDQPHGYRELGLEDESGNTLVFAQQIDTP